MAKKEDGHSWISNGLKTEVVPPPREEDPNGIETVYTDFEDLARFSREEGILINRNSVRGAKFAR